MARLVDVAFAKRLTQLEAITHYTNQLEYLYLNRIATTSVDVLPPLSNNSDSRLYRLNAEQPNARENTRLRTSRLITFNPKETTPISTIPTFPIIETQIALEKYSPSYTYRAIIRNKKDEKGEDRTVLEIWNSSNLVRSLRLSDIHGDIYDDSSFTHSPLVWSADEKKIMYIAEKKEEKKISTWDEMKTQDDVNNYLDKYTYKQDIGEGFGSKRRPELYIYNLGENEVYKVLNLPKNTLPAFPSFIDDRGNKILLNAFETDGFFTGVRFCFNNPVSIYLLMNLVLKKTKEEPKKSKLEEEEEEDEQETHIINNPPMKISTEYMAIFPRLSPDRTRLSYLFHDKPQRIHNFNLGLKIINFNDPQAPKEVVPIVQDSNDEFNGICGFAVDYENMGWLSDSKHFAFPTDMKGGVRIFLVNTETKELKQLDTRTYQSEEWQLLKVDGNNIIARITHRLTPDRVAIYSGLQLDAKSIGEATANGKWTFYETLPTEQSPFFKEKPESLEARGEFQEEVICVKGIEAFFWWVKDYKNDDGEIVPDQFKPLIVLIHGGPHSSCTGAYSRMIHLLLCKGFCVLAPNFSGSTGYGQKFIENLAGKTGKEDVAEITAIIHKLLENNRVDAKKIGLYGGSYGGYLGFAFLTQYPEQFRAAVLANPVVNYLHAYFTSDIPEWSLTESCDKDYGTEITPQDLERMIEMSPALKGNKRGIKTKILLALGAKDKRVPPGGAVEYYRNLKKEGVPIECLYYPDEGHSLAGSIENQFDVVLRTLVFLESNMRY